MMGSVDSNFNGFRLLERVGPEEGCNVFRAVNHQGTETVAIKIFSSEIGRNRQLVERLRASFQSLARINHPSILPVKGFGVHEGCPYVVMPFLEAGSLEDRIAFGAFSAINIESLLTDLVLALETAHSKGQVHGNLKPSNILFDENGNVLINGIGEEPLANAMDCQSPDIEAERIDYRAPEVRARGRPTPLSDQYSLGLILLQLQTRLPLEEAIKRLELRLEYEGQFRTIPRSHSLDLPSNVIRVLSRALSEKPTDRFPSTKAMFQSLEAALWNEMPPSEQKPIQEEVETEKRRSKPGLIIGLGLAMALCLLLMGPVLSSQGDDVVGNIFSFIGMTKRDGIGGDSSLKAGTIEAVVIFTLAPNETEIGVEEVESQTPDASSTVENDGNNVGTPTPTTPPASATETKPPPPNTATLPPPATPIPTFSPVPTLVPTLTAVPSSTPTLTPTHTQPPPTSEPTIDPDRCRRDPESDRYCTRTPEPTIPPDQCSRHYHSDDYCTPTPSP